MKSIITNDIITKVSNDSKIQSNSLSPYIFGDYDVIGIGAVRVVILKDSYYLQLSEDIGKTYMKAWGEDVGKLLSRDLKKNDRSHFYEFKTPTYRVLLRRVDEDKINEFKELGFLHVIIGDYYYTIIKLINNDDITYSKVNTIIDESLQDKQIEDDNDEEEVENANIDDMEEVESLSLFD